MKKSMSKKVAGMMGIALLTAGLASTSALAYGWFRAHANAYVSPSSVEGSLCNTGNYPLMCRVDAFGITHGGARLHTYAQNVLYPGQCVYSYVYSNYEPFRNGFAKGRCRSL